MDKKLSQKIVNDKKFKAIVDLRETNLNLEIIHNNIKEIQMKMKANITEDNKQKIIDAIKSFDVFLTKSNIEIQQPNQKSSILDNFAGIKNEEIKFNTNERINKISKLNKANIIDLKYNHKLHEEIEYSIKNIKKQLNIVFKPTNIILQSFDKDYKFDKVDNFLEDYSNELENIKLKNNNLKLKIKKIKKLKKILLNSLNIDVIKQSVNLLEITKKKEIDEDIQNSDLALYNKKLINMKDYVPVSKPVPEPNLDPDPELDPEPDKVLYRPDFLLNLGKIYINTEIINVKHNYKKNTENYKTIVDELKITYIQYKNYELLFINFFKNIEKITSYKIKIFLTLPEIISIYKKYKKKYNIIKNPKKYIINETKNKDKNKKMYLEDFFQIFIIYYFFKFLIKKIISRLSIEIKLDNIKEWKNLFTNDKEYIIYLLNKNTNLELQKMLILINSYIIK